LQAAGAHAVQSGLQMGAVGRELLRILPAVVLLYAVFVCAIPALLLWTFSSLTVPSFSAAFWLGLGLASAGLLLYVRVVWELVALAGTSASPLGTPTQLRTHGSYAWSRNPLLLGVVAILFGQAVAFRSIALAVYAVAYWTWLHVFIVVREEPMLQAQFGERYARYCGRVPRWFVPRRMRS
jgi:protein-S-isoprenylcysteine O-methyltransferase Ste14